MRILHTADWHLGKRLLNESLRPDQEAFFQWLLDTIETERIELLLVPGDIFDVSHPANDALQLYYDFLKKLTHTRCHHAIITAGNHDSPGTLDAPRQLLRAFDIHVMGACPEVIRDEIIEVKNEGGETAAVVAAVPFLRDRDIREAISGETYDDIIERTRAGIIQHYRQVAEATRPYREASVPVIAMGHLYVQGSTLSESERDIQIGNAAGVEGRPFQKWFDYTALGHIHQPQAVRGLEQVRYCGSPLPLSFSEKAQQKSVTLLEVNNGLVELRELLPVPAFRQLLSFNGSFQQVIARLTAHQPNRSLTDLAELEITEHNYDPELSLKINEMIAQFPNIKVLKYRLHFTGQTKGADELYAEDAMLHDLKPREVFAKRLETENAEQRQTLITAFNRLLETDLDDLEQAAG